MSIIQKFNFFEMIVPVKEGMINSKGLYKVLHIEQFYASVLQHGYGLGIEIDERAIETYKLIRRRSIL